MATTAENGVNNPNGVRANNPNGVRANNPNVAGVNNPNVAGVNNPNGVRANNPNEVRGNNSYIATPEVRAHGGTPEGNTNYPYGATPKAGVNNPNGVRANNPNEAEITTFGETRFGASSGGTRFEVTFSGVTGRQQPLSMVSYKLFLRTGMYLKGNKLEGNPLTKAEHDTARADFEAELEALKHQVVVNEENQALTLEFEPLRNNYWLNNNGYDQLLNIHNGI